MEWFSKSDTEDMVDLIKAGKGEGSKGGKVVGHTKSGKPIYDSNNPKHHAGWNKKDHLDAREHFLTSSLDYEDRANHGKPTDSTYKKYRSIANRHGKIAMYHDEKHRELKNKKK